MARADHTAPAAPERLESILEFRATGELLQFRVYSGGCTQAEHFHVRVERRDGQAELTLIRLVPDNCKGHFPQGTEISFGYDTVGLDRTDAIRLVNPIQSRSVAR
jgi:hypothetical protein